MGIDQAGIGAEGAPLHPILHDHAGIKAAGENGVFRIFPYKGYMGDGYGNLFFIEPFVNVEDLFRNMVCREGTKSLSNAFKISCAIF